MASNLYSDGTEQFTDAYAVDNSERRRSLPVKFYLSVLAVIFAAEACVMFLLPYFLPKMASAMTSAVLDALLLSLLVPPLIWWLSIRPLRTLIRLETAKFRSLLEAAPDGIVGVDEQGRIVLVNTHAEELFGYSRRELLGQPVEMLIPEKMREAHVRHRAAFFSAPRMTPMGTGLSLTAWRRDGTEFAAEISLGLLKTNQGPYVISIIRDVSHRKQTEEALAQANQKLTAGVRELERAAQEMALLQEMGGLLQSCRKTEEAYRVTANYSERLFPGRQGCLAVMNASRNMLETAAVWGGPCEGEQAFLPEDCWALRLGRIHLGDKDSCGLACMKEKTAHASQHLCVPMTAQGEILGVMRLRVEESAAPERISRLASISSEQVGLALANLKLRETLRNESVRDALTGVFNRRYLEESLERELARAQRAGGLVGVIMLDIDHFKRFNDTHGHEAGDAVQRALGNFLRTHLRKSDIVCRFGGDEFAIILPEAAVEDTVARAEELRSSIRNMEVLHRGSTLEVLSLSLGVAVFPLHGEASEEILRAADKALYDAKTRGRNCVAVAVAPTKT